MLENLVPKYKLFTRKVFQLEISSWWRSLIVAISSLNFILLLSLQALLTKLYLQFLPELTKSFNLTVPRLRRLSLADHSLILHLIFTTSILNLLRQADILLQRLHKRQNKFMMFLLSLLIFKKTRNL